MTADDRATLLSSIWDMLAKGAASRKSPVHAPVVATIDAEGFPTQRVMILREALRDTRMLRFHTDARSPKVGEIANAPNVSALAYHPDEAIQLRMRAIATAEIMGEEAETAWQSSTLFARRCYMSEFAPGTLTVDPISGLPSWIAGKMPNEAQVEPARENFAILKVQVYTIDWLHLANSGHKRARLTYADGRWNGEWIIP